VALASRLGGSVPFSIYTPHRHELVTEDSTLGPRVTVEFGATGGARWRPMPHREARNAGIRAEISLIAHLNSPAKLAKIPCSSA
jgi:hypothetical protein